MTTLPPVKPCPFCGSPATVEEIEAGASIRPDAVRFSVGCNESGEEADMCMGYQSLTSFNTRHEAVDAWNRRTKESV